MKEKILMYRWEGQTEWKEYKDNAPTMGIADYEVAESTQSNIKLWRGRKINE